MSADETRENELDVCARCGMHAATDNGVAISPPVAVDNGFATCYKLILCRDCWLAFAAWIRTRGE